MDVLKILCNPENTAAFIAASVDLKTVLQSFLTFTAYLKSAWHFWQVH